MTTDKEFKQVVRNQAKSTGRRYSAVQAEMRPPQPTTAAEPAVVADRFARIVETIGTWVRAEHDLVGLVATALLVPGNVLVRGRPGNGMTVLAQGVAAAIGGRPVFIDGRDGLGCDPTGWRNDDVVMIGHFDGLEPAAQMAVIANGQRPAIVLAKCHPIPARMPYPPDDETRERFLFSVDLDYGGADTLLRIVNDIRDPTRGGGRLEADTNIAGLAAMRAALSAVDIPDNVRRFAVDAVTATRTDTDVLIGGSVIATLALLDSAAAVAIADRRTTVNTDDVTYLLKPVLSHRLVYRDETGTDVDSLMARLAAAAHTSTTSRAQST